MKTAKSSILAIAVPSIVSNITVPLLALVDTTIAGHLGSPAALGAIAVGGMVFNMIYWLFGFLRMGTGGLTAQACGAGRTADAHCVLRRALLVAAAIGLLFIVLQRPIIDAVFATLSATPEVEAGARPYFSVLVWGAPAVLALYAFTGWFLGMQNARIPMYISILQNIVNIGVSLWLAVDLGLGIGGIAVGTLAAQLAGVLTAAALYLFRCGGRSERTPWHTVLDGRAVWRFFSINGHLFLRTLCLVAVTTSFTALGTSMGELTLAANTLLMQFFVLFSYVMDGFAYAGEAIGGHCVGSGDRAGLLRLTRRLFACGGGMVAAFTAVYALGGSAFLGLLTDNADVVRAALPFLAPACCIPALGVAAFIFDGLCIGLTATREMLLSVAAAAVVYGAVLWTCGVTNHVLWAAFLSYLAVRGAVLALTFRRSVRKSFSAAPCRLSE